MKANWAILNNENVVIDLLYVDIEITDTSNIEGEAGLVKYSAPFESRGVPVIGSVWIPLEDRFV